MDMEKLQDFFLWCLIINSGVYALTAIMALLFRNLLCRIHRILFDMDEKAVIQVVQSYLANYKLLITVFNFAPWLALLIIG